MRCVWALMFSAGWVIYSRIRRREVWDEGGLGFTMPRLRDSGSFHIWRTGDVRIRRPLSPYLLPPACLRRDTPVGWRVYGFESAGGWSLDGEASFCPRVSPRVTQNPPASAVLPLHRRHSRCPAGTTSRPSSRSPAKMWCVSPTEISRGFTQRTCVSMRPEEGALRVVCETVFGREV